jgi:hypothetical protein
VARKIIERLPVTKPLLGIMNPYLRLHHGAGDENRTRTISLGSRAVTAAKAADLPVLVVRSSRDCPLVTLANGTLMAQRSSSSLRADQRRAAGGWLAASFAVYAVTRWRRSSMASGLAALPP